MPTPPLDALESLVHRVSQSSCGLQATEMPGGASTRRYYRVEMPNGSSAIAMYVPEVGKPDEFVKVDESGRRWPFLEVRELMASRDISVPRVLGEACDQGFLLLEDLGDDTLANYLLRRPERKTNVYQIAVRDLARAQRVLQDLPAESIVRERAFDEELLAWEVDHFREWALEARGIQLTAPQRQVFDSAREWLASTVSAWPRGFVHRDYQSRNLMVRQHDNNEEELVWIDFQDALLGPRVYDLVALLNDSYQSFDRAFVEARLDEYATHLGVSEAASARVVREFDIVTVQRKLKDAGRFVFIDREKNNPNFLPFVESTIEKARLSLSRVTDEKALLDLGELLAELFD